MKFITVTAVCALLFYITVNAVKKNLYQILLSLLQSGDYPSFYRKTDSFIFRLFFSRIFLLDLQLNASILENNVTVTEDILQKLLNSRTCLKDRHRILMKAFNYYLSAGSQANLRKCLSLIECEGSLQMIKEASRVYHIFADKSDVDLDDLLQEMECLPPEQRGIHEYLIARIYENRKEEDKALQYRMLCQRHFEMQKNASPKLAESQ